MNIAIVGSGISGLVAAHRLYRTHRITVYEAGDHVGGHTHTHEVHWQGDRQAIDTGFIVYNERTYPNFIRLLDELGVATQPSTMSFSVHNAASGLEYNGSTLAGLFVQPRNLLRPSFHRMLAEILRFHREARIVLDEPREIPLGTFLARGRYGRPFIDDFLLPMAAAIWSTDPYRMLDFPARHFVRFLDNHGMLQVNHRPPWRTVAGGSARYVDAITAPWRERILLKTPVEAIRREPGGVLLKAQNLPLRRYDHVFLACHADQALRLLADPSPDERRILSAIPTQRNEAVLHTDIAWLPRARRAWAAWNAHVTGESEQRVSLTYQMNILQRLHSPHHYCVTLNPTREIAPRHVIGRWTYQHPVFTPEGVAAQARHAEISAAPGNGGRTHYCGAWWRYGFHEDGVVSALAALQRFEQQAHDAQRDLPRVA